MATPRPPAPTPAPKRYSLTFKDHHDQAHGFHDCDTADEARAWLETMLGKATGKPTPAPPARAIAAPPVREVRVGQAGWRSATVLHKSAPPSDTITLSPESSEALVRAFLTATGPSPTPPRPGTLAARLLASLRTAGPADVATLRQRHPTVAGSAVRGRMSELAAAGWVVCRDEVYHATTSGEPFPASDPTDPLAARILECLARQPMRLGVLAQYTSRRVVDLLPAINALVDGGQVIDNGGLFRLATSPTPPEAAVKSSPVRAAPSPPPARKGNP